VAVLGSRYQASFRFGDEPRAPCRGSPILVDDNDPMITLGPQHDEGYPVSKVL
jgi:hypothetical protein